MNQFPSADPSENLPDLMQQEFVYMESSEGTGEVYSNKSKSCSISIDLKMIPLIIRILSFGVVLWSVRNTILVERCVDDVRWIINRINHKLFTSNSTTITSKKLICFAIKLFNLSNFPNNIIPIIPRGLWNSNTFKIPLKFQLTISYLHLQHLLNPHRHNL